MAKRKKKSSWSKELLDAIKKFLASPLNQGLLYPSKTKKKVQRKS